MVHRDECVPWHHDSHAQKISSLRIVWFLFLIKHTIPGGRYSHFFHGTSSIYRCQTCFWGPASYGLVIRSWLEPTYGHSWHHWWHQDGQPWKTVAKKWCLWWKNVCFLFVFDQYIYIYTVFETMFPNPCDFPEGFLCDQPTSYGVWQISSFWPRYLHFYVAAKKSMSPTVTNCQWHQQLLLMIPFCRWFTFPYRRTMLCPCSPCISMFVCDPIILLPPCLLYPNFCW